MLYPKIYAYPKALFRNSLRATRATHTDLAIYWKSGKNRRVRREEFFVLSYINITFYKYNTEKFI